MDWPENMCSLQSNRNVVVVVGGTGVDNVARPLQTIRSRASNPVFWQRFAGGVATNVARGISHQLSAHLICAVGDDLDGQLLIGKLSDNDIKVAPFSVQSNSTGSYTAVLDEGGELFIGLSDFKAIELLTWEHIKTRLPQNTPYAIVIDANLSQQCITDAVNALPTNQLMIFALTVSPSKAIRWLPVADDVHALFCNRAEASALTSLPKSSPLDQLADGLMNSGFRQFVISDGSSPALVQELNNGRHEPDLVDSTRGSFQRIWVSVPELPDELKILSTVNGAGDAMAAATIAHYLQETNASLASSLTLSGMPAAMAILTGERSPIQLN